MIAAGLYDIPTPEELRLYLEGRRISSATLARVAGAAPEDARAWLAGEAPVPWSAWALVRVYAGDLDREGLGREVFGDGQGVE